MACGRDFTNGDVINCLAQDVFRFYDRLDNELPGMYSTGESLSLVANYEFGVSRGSQRGISSYFNKLRNDADAFIEDDASKRFGWYNDSATSNRNNSCLINNNVKTVAFNNEDGVSMTLDVIAKDVRLSKYLHPVFLWAKRRNGCDVIPQNLRWHAANDVAFVMPGAGAASMRSNGTKEIMLTARAPAVVADPPAPVPINFGNINNYFMLDCRSRINHGTLNLAANQATSDGIGVNWVSGRDGSKKVTHLDGRLSFNEIAVLQGLPAEAVLSVEIEGRLIPTRYKEYFRMNYTGALLPNYAHFADTLGLIYSTIESEGDRFLPSLNAHLIGLNGQQMFINNVIPNRFLILTGNQLFSEDFFNVINDNDGINAVNLVAFRRHMMEWYINCVALLMILHFVSRCCS